MMADVFNFPINTIGSFSGPTLGVAILAGVGVGIYPSGRDACRQITKKNQGIAPREENHEKYMKYYSLYRELYPDLLDDYRTLAELRKSQEKQKNLS